MWNQHPQRAMYVGLYGEWERKERMEIRHTPNEVGEAWQNKHQENTQRPRAPGVGTEQQANKQRNYENDTIWTKEAQHKSERRSERRALAREAGGQQREQESVRQDSELVGPGDDLWQQPSCPCDHEQADGSNPQSRQAQHDQPKHKQGREVDHCRKHGRSDATTEARGDKAHPRKISSALRVRTACIVGNGALFGEVPAVLVEDNGILGRQKEMRCSQKRPQDRDAVNRKRKANRAV